MELVDDRELADRRALEPLLNAPRRSLEPVNVRAPESVTLGVYRYDGEVYWAEMDYWGFVSEDERSTVTGPSVTPPS